MNEKIALKVIASLMYAWEKIVIKLEAAIDFLSKCVEDNNKMIIIEEERSKEKISFIIEKNKNLKKEIEKAIKFKSNVKKIVEE